VQRIAPVKRRPLIKRRKGLKKNLLSRIRVRCGPYHLMQQSNRERGAIAWRPLKVRAATRGEFL
jgi:hypothetical protein